MKITVKQLRKIIREEIVREAANPEIRRIVSSTSELSASDAQRLEALLKEINNLVVSKLLFQLAQNVKSMRSKNVKPDVLAKFLKVEFDSRLMETLQDALGLLTKEQYDSLAYNLESRNEDIMSGELMTSLVADPLDTIKTLQEDPSYANATSLYILADQLENLHEMLSELANQFMDGGSAAFMQSSKMSASKLKPEKKKGFFSFLG